MLIGDGALKPPLSFPPLLCLSASLSVNFNLERSTPPYDKVGPRPAGTKIDVYLVASFLIIVITITSSLPGSSLMLSFSESNKTIR